MLSGFPRDRGALTADATTAGFEAKLDLAVGRAATPANVGDELSARLQQHFNNPQLVELTTDIALGNSRSRFNRVSQCQPAGFPEGACCPVPEK